MGGSSGSSSSSTTQTTTQQIDKRLVVDNGVGVSSDSSTVNVNALDGGAIAGAFDFSKIVATNNGKTVSELIAVAGDVFEKAYGTLDKQANFVSAAGDAVAAAYSEAKGDGSAKYYIGAGVVAVIGLAALNGKIKP